MLFAEFRIFDDLILPILCIGFLVGLTWFIVAACRSAKKGKSDYDPNNEYIPWDPDH